MSILHRETEATESHLFLSLFSFLLVIPLPFFLSHLEINETEAEQHLLQFNEEVKGSDCRLVS